MRDAGASPAGSGGLGGGRGATRLTANFPPIEDARANFFGAHGNVVSGAISLAAGDGPATLLVLTDASLAVSAEVGPDNAVAVTVHNGAAVPLTGAQDLDGNMTQVALAAGAGATITLPDGRVHRLHLQIFPNGPPFSDVVALLVTTEHGSIVGQACVTAIE